MRHLLVRQFSEAVSVKTDHRVYFENSILLISWDFEALTSITKMSFIWLKILIELIEVRSALPKLRACLDWKNST